MGYAVEFLDEETIFSRYGENGITEYDLVNGVAEISDDTQMTLFTANGLLLGTTRGMTRGIMGSYPSYIAFCYKDWLRTQCEKYPLNEESPYSWLINIPELYNRRAPGNTCLIAALQEFGVDIVTVHSTQGRYDTACRRTRAFTGTSEIYKR